MNSLSKFDYFSQSFSVHFNKNRYKTVLGGILTLILVCVGIPVFIIHGMELVDKRRPFTSIERKYALDSALLLPNRSSFFLAFSVLDSNMVPLNDQSYFTINVKQVVKNSSLNSPIHSYKIIKFHNCSKTIEDFEDLSDLLYDKKSLTNAQCLYLKNNPMEKSAEISNHYFSNLLIKVNPCVSDSNSNSNCKSKSEIDETLRGS